jgi:hypothetical protein
MNVLRIVFEKTRDRCRLGAMGLMCVAFLQGAPVNAQNKNVQSQAAETVTTQLMAAEATFQHTEAQIASRNMAEPAPTNATQNAATNTPSEGATPAQNAQGAATNPAPAAQQGSAPAEPPPSEEESH